MAFVERRSWVEALQADSVKGVVPQVEMVMGEGIGVRRRARLLLFSADQRLMMNKIENNGLERGLGLKEAVALNMIEIVGIGPFVVSSLVIRAMGGPQALIAWLAGALLATLDGFVWSELGAAMPKAGGTYVFLREAYGPERWGRLMSFLFVWQTFVQAPLSVASAISMPRWRSISRREHLTCRGCGWRAWGRQW